MHLTAHDRIAIAHGTLAAAQTYADIEKPVQGQVTTEEYIDSIRRLVDAVSEYGDAVALLGAMLTWKWTLLQRDQSSRR